MVSKWCVGWMSQPSTELGPNSAGLRRHQLLQGEGLRAGPGKERSIRAPHPLRHLLLGEGPAGEAGGGRAQGHPWFGGFSSQSKANRPLSFLSNFGLLLVEVPKGDHLLFLKRTSQFGVQIRIFLRSRCLTCNQSEWTGDLLNC